MCTFFPPSSPCYEVNMSEYQLQETLTITSYLTSRALKPQHSGGEHSPEIADLQAHKVSQREFPLSRNVVELKKENKKKEKENNFALGNVEE